MTGPGAETSRPAPSRRLTVALVVLLVALTVASAVVWWQVASPAPEASLPVTGPASPSPTGGPVSVPGDGLPRSDRPLADDEIVVRYNVGTDWTMSTISSSGSQGEVVLASGEQEIAPVVSHDRRTVLYLRRERPGVRTSLHAVAADGSVQRLLLRDGSPGCPFLRQVVWSVDGTLGIVCKLDEEGRTFTLGTARTDGTFIRTLDVGLIGSPTFSPDGRQLLYPKASSGSWERGGPLYLTDVDGSSEPTRVAGGRNTGPAWAPSGRTVAFSRYVSVAHADDPAHVVTMAVDGVGTPERSVRELTSGADIDTDPSWSPDGRSLVFRHASDKHDDHLSLVVVPSDGGRARELSLDGTVGTPCWTPR